MDHSAKGVSIMTPACPCCGQKLTRELLGRVLAPSLTAIALRVFGAKNPLSVLVALGTAWLLGDYLDKYICQSCGLRFELVRGVLRQLA